MEASGGSMPGVFQEQGEEHSGGALRAGREGVVDKVRDVWRAHVWLVWTVFRTCCEWNGEPSESFVQRSEMI